MLWMFILYLVFGIHIRVYSIAHVPALNIKKNISK